MFKTLWNSLHTPAGEGNDIQSAFDRNRLKMLAEYFPLGKKIRYYPEFRREIVFHTIVIAYRVNEQFLYSRDAVLMDDDGLPTGFVLSDKSTLPVGKLKKLQLLLPDTTEMEKTLDYFTRAELGRAGQFRQGNTITLVAETAERGIPTVDTTVDRRQTLSSGPYADNSTILVTPDLSTLAVADQRRRQRVQTETPARLYVADDAPAFNCVLGDFSESSLRLRLAEGQEVMPQMAAGDKVVVSFTFGEVASTYRFRGAIFRRADDFCVVQLEQLYKDGEYERIKMMDIMEIKTGLLNPYS